MNDWDRGQGIRDRDALHDAAREPLTRMRLHCALINHRIYFSTKGLVKEAVADRLGPGSGSASGSMCAHLDTSVGTINIRLQCTLQTACIEHKCHTGEE